MAEWLLNGSNHRLDGGVDTDSRQRNYRNMMSMYCILCVPVPVCALDESRGCSLVNRGRVSEYGASVPLMRCCFLFRHSRSVAAISWRLREMIFCKVVARWVF